MTYKNRDLDWVDSVSGQQAPKAMGDAGSQSVQESWDHLRRKLAPPLHRITCGLDTQKTVVLNNCDREAIRLAVYAFRSDLNRLSMYQRLGLSSAIVASQIRKSAEVLEEFKQHQFDIYMEVVLESFNLDA